MPKPKSKKHAKTVTSNDCLSGPYTAVRESKSERRLKKKKQKWIDGTLTREELSGLPWNEQKIYLQREIGKKYHIPQNNVQFECKCCAQSVLYEPGRSISDRDLLRTIHGLKKL